MREKKMLECPKCGSKREYYTKALSHRLDEGRSPRCAFCKASLLEIGDPENGGAAEQIYDCAEELVRSLGYGPHIEALKELLEDEIYREVGVREFFREYTWVVFASGFRADIVRSKWRAIRNMLGEFDPAFVRKRGYEKLLEDSPIKNRNKVRALLKGSLIITEAWVEELRGIEDPEELRARLRALPYIGEVTVWHLMRNLGVDVFKPDRHINNLSELLGTDPEGLFEQIVEAGRADYTGVADYILWRACASLGGAQALVERTYDLGGGSRAESARGEMDKFLF
jgi:hypothetical protein